MKFVVLDLDDYCDERNGLDMLWRLRARFPDFKVTLWTVPGWSTPEFLKMSSQWDWLEMGLHGWTHEADEVQKWDVLNMQSKIGQAEVLGYFVNGFHSPGWGHNMKLITLLRDSDWFYQAHPKNERDIYFPEMKMPEGLKVYYPGEDMQQIGKWKLYGNGYCLEPLLEDMVLRIHGHTGNFGVTNSLEYHFPRIMQFPTDTKFLFISELFK